MNSNLMHAARSPRASPVKCMALIAAGALAACSTIRSRESSSADPAAVQTVPPTAPAAPEAASAPPAEPAAGAPEPTPEPVQPEMKRAAAATPAATRTPETTPAAAAPPPCVCSQPALKARPKKHKRKPKAALNQPEPQSVGPAPPSKDGVVDAEVGRIDAPLTSILGKDVFSPKGEALGRVVDLLADAEGRVRVAIIDFGGFLGVGTRRIAVDWPLLHFTPGDKDKSLRLTVTREKLQSAPEYKDSDRPRVLVPPAATPDAAGADTKK
jgi:hypothetical protein